MKFRLFFLAAVCAAVAFAQDDRNAPNPGFDDTPVLPGQKWKVHDKNRPIPRKVTPGAQCGAAPSDAVVLFDGKDLSQWEQRGRGDNKGRMVSPAWLLRDGYTEIVPRTGELISKAKFGDAQYHIEWQIPADVKYVSQWRGNSGILIMGRYEIQVLESSNNATYADGHAGAIYGQWPPLVIASRQPGEWQSYDIIFEGPRFEGEKLVRPAYVTVLLNGVVLHHRKELIGRMTYRAVGTYAPHATEEPLVLQDHDIPVRYRNIWVRPIGDYDKP